MRMSRKPSGLKLPYCPNCDEILQKEDPHLGGLTCEKCGIGFTYSFAVRKGYVDEMVPGDQKQALESWHFWNRLRRVGLKV